jgi:hypothetical protein
MQASSVAAFLFAFKTTKRQIKEAENNAAVKKIVINIYQYNSILFYGKYHVKKEKLVVNIDGFRLSK